MTARCARCGNCCENITCGSYDDAVKWTTPALEGIPDPSTEDGWQYWMEHGDGHWTEPEREKAVRWFADGSRMRADADFMAAHWKPVGDGDDGTRYNCDMFDQVTRLCTAHDSRPPVCRDYPWYGREPNAEDAAHIGLECSYLADLPPADRPEGARPLIPLLVLS